MDAFVGIDVAFAKRKLLPLAVCTVSDGHLIPLPLRSWRRKPPRGSGNVATLDAVTLENFAVATRDYLLALEVEYGVTIQRIAIDAPSNPCLATQSRRSCEQALDAQGISCFSTPSRADFDDIRIKVQEHLRSGGKQSHLPHANQLWMLVGFALFRILSEHFPCLEVYPQAIVRSLGVSRQHKSKQAGLQAQMEGIAAITGWPNSAIDLFGIGFGSRHDKLDAYLSAWIASLPSHERYALGEVPNDAIWVPGPSPASSTLVGV